MIKIQQHVRDIIRSNPMFEAALEMKVANFSRLARKIKPLVEKKRMEKVGLSAIVMALRRLKLPEKDARASLIIDSIVVHSDLIEFVFAPSKNFLKEYAHFCKIVAEKDETSYISLINGPVKSALIISASLRKDALLHLKNERMVAVLEKIAGLEGMNKHIESVKKRLQT